MVEDRFIIIPLKQESSAESRKVECMGGGALEVLTFLFIYYYCVQLSLCLLVKMTLEKKWSNVREHLIKGKEIKHIYDVFSC